MLLLGPPKICIAPFPWMFRADCCGVDLGVFGSNTKIGIGAAASVTPQVANARTVCVRLPVSIPAKKVSTLFLTWTCRNAFGAIVFGGGLTPGGAPVET